MRKTICASLFAILFVLQASFGFSQEETNWNQFRGENRTGISPEINIPDNFPETGLKLVWKKKIGSSFSELTYVDGVIYTMFSEQIDSTSGFEYLGAFDPNTGKELWKTKVDSLYIDHDNWGNGPRATPTVDDETIFTFSAYGKLTASAKKNGKQIWQVDFMNEFGSTIPRWGFTASPLLVDDLVVMEAGGTESRAFVAFHKKDGKIAWAKGNGPATYSSPLLAEINGEKQILFANGRTLYSFNTQGDTIWTYTTMNASGHVTPVMVESNKVFLSTIGRGFTIIEINDNKPKEFISGSTMKNDFSSCIYYDGYIYGFHIAALQCISAETGEKKWTKRGFGKGSLMMADGKLFVLSDRGKLIQVKATPEAYVEQGSFQAIDGKSWTAPSIANGKIFVRNLTEMACYELK